MSKVFFSIACKIKRNFGFFPFLFFSAHNESEGKTSAVDYPKNIDNLFDKINSSNDEDFVQKLCIKANNMEELILYVGRSFGPYYARLLFLAIRQHLGEDWYDPKSETEILFIRTKTTKVIRKISFVGGGKRIQFSLKDYQNTNVVVNDTSDLIKLTINTKNTFENSRLPYGLVSNIKAYIKKINHSVSKYKYLDVYYRAASFKVEALVFYNLKKSKLYFINCDGLIVNKKGVSVSPSLYIPSFGVSDKPVITSRFGWRRHPILKRKIFHSGIDLKAPKGSKIIAAYDGQIVFAGWLPGYGRCIKIDHGNFTVTIYAHLSQIPKTVKKSKWVQKGDLIGLSGSSGLAKGAHLHFEVRVRNKPVDPLKFKFVKFNQVSKTVLGLILQEIYKADQLYD